MIHQPTLNNELEIDHYASVSSSNPIKEKLVDIESEYLTPFRLNTSALEKLVVSNDIVDIESIGLDVGHGDSYLNDQEDTLKFRLNIPSQDELITSEAIADIDSVGSRNSAYTPLSSEPIVGYNTHDYLLGNPQVDHINDLPEISYTGRNGSPEVQLNDSYNYYPSNTYNNPTLNIAQLKDYSTSIQPQYDSYHQNLPTFSGQLSMPSPTLAPIPSVSVP